MTQPGSPNFEGAGAWEVSRPMCLEVACERILGQRAAQAIIHDQGLRWAIVAAVATARTTDDAAALAELRRYPHAMQQAELDFHEEARRSRRHKAKS